MNSRIVIVTGASSGIGLATAQLFKARGDIVYGLSRRPCPDSSIMSLTADVTDSDAVKRAIDSVVSKHGRLDVLVCNAGFGISGTVEFTEISDAKRQFDVNVFGTMSCIRVALTHMREKQSGHIIVTSSVAGAIAIPFQAYYSATKAALNSLVMATNNEVRPYGIKLCAVMPGDIKTGFTDARVKLNEETDCYASLQRSVVTMEKDERNGMSPTVIAKKIYSISRRRNPKPLCSVGIVYKACCMLGKLLPCRLTNWIVSKMYAG